MKHLLLVLVENSIADFHLMSCSFCYNSFLLVWNYANIHSVNVLMLILFKIQKTPRVILYLSFYFPSHYKFKSKLLHIIMLAQ